MVRWSLCFAIAAVVAWLGSASAVADSPSDGGGEQLSLTLAAVSADAACSAGLSAEVRWEASGGEGPYELIIDSQDVDVAAESATIACGTALTDAPYWLVESERAVVIDAVVGDASGNLARASLRLTVEPPLQAPQPYGVHASGGWSDYYGSGLAGSLGVMGDGNRLRQDHRYVIRWRAVGGGDWRYMPFTRWAETPSDQISWWIETETNGVRHELEAARIRSFAEVSTPDRLNWSRRAYVTTGAPSSEHVVRATHDSIHVSWGPKIEGLKWDVWLYAPYSPWRDGPIQERVKASFDSQYQAVFQRLTPDTDYEIRIQPSTYYDPGVTVAVRTEPPPEDWSAEAYAPQNLRAELRDGRVWVTWEPPAEGPEGDYQIDIYEYGEPESEWLRYERHAGEYAVSSEKLLSGTTYEVVVGHRGRVDAEVRHVFQTPRSFGYNQVNEHLPLPIVQVTTHTIGDTAKEGYEFRVWAISDVETAYVEVELLRDGHALGRIDRPGRFVFRTDEPGPFVVRARRYAHQRWSGWTSVVGVAATPEPPVAIEVQQRVGELRVSWLPAESDTAVDGYRAYLHEPDGSVQVVDARRSVTAAFPVEAAGGTYQVHVSSYSHALGEGRARSVDFEAGRELAISIEETSIAGGCDPYDRWPARLSWEVRGGVAPYVIAMGDAEAVTTADSAGMIELPCERASEELSSQGTRIAPLVAMVTDAIGASIEVNASFNVLGREESWDGDETATYWWWSGSANELGQVSEHQTSMWLSLWGSWDQRPYGWYYLRWRMPGSIAWTYQLIHVTEYNGPSGGKWHWTDLRPDTEYEFQIAKYRRGFLAHEMDQLEWSNLQTARTLPDKIESEVTKHGDDVVVTWPAVERAWGYHIAVRAGGSSWWQDYWPNGEKVEEVVFSGLPADLEYEAVILTPPRRYGEELRAPGFDYVDTMCCG